MPPFERRKPSDICVGVGLSGGVDSAASALVLREHGFNVVGLFMMNWNPYIEAAGVGCADSELSAVRSLCGPKGLDIPLQLIEFDDEYFNSVFVQFVESLSAGFCTPNPDSHCARRIAFGQLHQSTLDMDYVATGHYASTHWTAAGYPLLMRSAERRYDQSYFLSRIDREALYRHLFPIGGHFKSKQKEVRSVVARHFGTQFAAKRSSTGLCYVDGAGDGVDGSSFTRFMGQFVDCNVGAIVDAFGRTLGQHNGLWLWTIGQRLRADEPEDGRHRFNQLAFTLYIARNVALYVLDKDVARNQLVVATECHSKLHNQHIVGWQWNWLCDDAVDAVQSNGDIAGWFRFRDKDALFPGVVRFDRERPDFGHIHLTESAVRAATPGQVVAMYGDNDICMASAIIQSVRK